MTRRVILFAMAGVLLLAVGWLAVRYVAPATSKRPSPTTVDATAGIAPRIDADRIEQVRVVQVSGRVERHYPGQPWRRARAGDELGAREAVRTTADATARLSVGPRSRVEVAGSSEMAVREITEAAHRLRLKTGRLSVSYQRDGRRQIQIESADGTATARAEEGRFSILGTARSMAVATQQGEVQLAAAGKDVVVRRGQQAAVIDGQAPDDPVAIPDEVLLTIAGLGRGAIRVKRPEATVTGQTQPGNQLTIGDRKVAPGRDGRFTARIPVGKGRTRIKVIAENPTGRRKAAEVTYLLLSKDPAPPATKKGKIDGIDIRWGR